MSEPTYFLQAPPELGDTYRGDRVLVSYLTRVLPEAVRREVEPSLEELGALAGGELYRQQLADRLHEPRLIRFDPWGRRVDEIELSPLWQRARELASRYGVVATAYERRHGAWSRVHQFALAYLFTPATDIYSCPLAMTDGAARTLELSGNRRLLERALPRLTSRDPERFWTSGQWMTETTGGSDVGRSQALARLEDGVWRLYGQKWFTSAATSEMALTLARPEGNGPGGKGLALFYLEVRDESGRLQGIEIDRLKDKLGTRKVPTAELRLVGTPAELVGEPIHGVKAITPMLNITRTWNAISAVSLMSRGLALARDYARRRVAFGAPLSEKPLHLDTLADLQAEMEGAFHLTFRLVQLLGREECQELHDGEADLLRALTPVAKLTTARQAVAVTSEVLESFGGAGYVEDTGLPLLLRDAQVLPIWEGTTNVLALDTLRALGEAGPAILRREVERAVGVVTDPSLAAAGRVALEALDRAGTWWRQAAAAGTSRLEVGARRFALTLGRCLELALLAEQAQWSLNREGDGRPAAAVRRLLRRGVDLLVHEGADDPAEAAALALDEPLPVRAGAAS